MTLSSFHLKGPFYELTVNFDTRDCSMPQAMLIESQRLIKCIADGKSLMESKYRIIHDQTSKPCTISGRLL